MNVKLAWLPNLFTSLTLVSGFYAITLALEGALNAAVHAILIAMLFDFLDGWIARKTNTVSAFGKEYDSLCDMVAFGLAPAMVVYCMLTWDSVLSWLVPAIFSCAVAMRLAKFNCRETCNSSFQGLPCTAGGPFVVLMCYFVSESLTPGASFVIASVTMMIAFLMNSNITYISLKKKHWLFTRRNFFVLGTVILLGVSVVPLNTIASILLLYVVSPIFGIKAFFVQRKARLAQNS